MEFLDGTTLKHRILGQPVSQSRHCFRSPSRSPTDWMPRIPPESPIVTSSPRTCSSPTRGHAKILDFGLAKVGSADYPLGIDPTALPTRTIQDQLTGDRERGGNRVAYVAGANPRRAS